MTLRECFDTLGLEPGATSQEIKEAVRDLIKVWHPDRFTDNPRLQLKAQEKLKRINEAYELIKEHWDLFSKKRNQPVRKNEHAKTQTKQPPAQDHKKSEILDKLKRKGKKPLSKSDMDKITQTLIMLMGDGKKKK